VPLCGVLLVALLLLYSDKLKDTQIQDTIIMGVEYTYSYDLADYLSGSPEEEEQSKQEVTNSLLSKPVAPSSAPESTSDYDPLGFLDVFSNMAQVTYNRASDVFKAYKPDREAVVNKVTTDYADEMERMAKESALLLAEQRKAGFDVIPEKYALSAAPEVTTTMLEFDPAPEKQTSVENLMGETYPDLDRPAKEPVSDMRDPFSRARASLMDRQGSTEGFRVAKDAVNADVVPSVGTNVATDTTTATSTFATIIKGDTSSTVDTTTSLTAGFDSLAPSEGTNIHLDGRNFVTLPHGIVPDSGSVKKADGTPFNPRGSHGLKKADLAGVDYSGATKFGISRTSYDSDEAWAKGVYAEFADRAATEFGSGFDDLSATAKEAAYDMAWNAGIGAAGWSSVKRMLNETAKDVAEQSTANLIGFTTNFRSGTEYPRGLLKRRLQTYNLVAKAGDKASEITTKAVKTGGVRTGTKYIIKRSDGTTLKTWTKPDNDEKIGTLQVPQ